MSNVRYLEYKLKDISSFAYGKMPDKTRLTNTGYPVFSGYRIVGYYPEYMYKREKLLIIARGVGGTGEMRISPPFAYVTNLSIIFNEDENIVDYRYLYYFLKNRNMRVLDTGSCQSQITINQLEDYQVLLPNKIIQKQISNFLSNLEHKIELNNRINTELEAMAKTLYDYWFVQFDFPDENGKPYKSSGGAMVWNEELKREIPVGWGVDKIADLLYVSLGGTPSTTVKEYWGNGNINWLNSGEIANFPIIDSELKVTEAALLNSATELLPKGSVMLSITRHLRPTVLAIDACANQSVVGIKEKGNIKYFYLYPYLKNEIPRLNSMRSGAQQPHINKDIVRESLIVIPNKNSKILENYNLNVKHLYELIINNAFQNQNLSKLRDWLLPMLMNGQVLVE